MSAPAELEHVAWHCSCGTSYFADVHPTVGERLHAAWLRRHSGPGHRAMELPCGITFDEWVDALARKLVAAAEDSNK
jgi:hypothetical protein